MTISVIVLNHNGEHLLADCLASLQTQDVPNLEILVVDNASADGSSGVVCRFAGVRWIPLAQNLGLGPGYNAGAARARGEYLFFLNNDTALEPDCLRQLAEAMREDVFAVDPLQVDWSGQRVVHGAQRFRFGWRYGLRPVPGLDPYQILTMDAPTEVPWACAGAMLVSRNKFEALGGFDPTFFLDYEDLDLCWRGWLRGWKTLFIPSARLRHRVGESGKVPGVLGRRALSQIKNAQRFTWKTMAWPLVTASLVGSLRSTLRAKACFLNLLEAAGIGAERRKVYRTSVMASSLLLRRSWE
jgi:GT2 family glycosyltransferase